MKKTLQRVLYVLGILLMLSYILLVLGGIVWEKALDVKGLELLLNKYVKGRCGVIYECKPGSGSTFCIAIDEENGQLLMAKVERDVLTDIVPMPQYRKVARHLVLGEEGILQEQELNPVPRDILGSKYLYPSWTLEESDGCFSRLSMAIGRVTGGSLEFGTLWVNFVPKESECEEAAFTMDWGDGMIEVVEDWETSYNPSLLSPAA